MKNKGSRCKYIVAGILCIIAILIITGVFMAFSDDFQGSENIANVDGLTAKITKSVILNKDITLNKDELNTLILNEVAKSDSMPSSVQSITFIPASEDDIMYIYIRVDFMGKTLGVNVKTRMKLQGGRLEAEVLQTKIGKLRVQNGLFLNKVKDKLEVEGSKIYFNPDMKMDILGVSVTLKLQKFKIENEQVTVNLTVKDGIDLPIMNWLK